MTDSAPTATDAAGPPARACANCGTPLLGPHCYRCGQPVDGLVRHFGSIMGDFLDTVLNIDARVFRTLWPLLSKPAYLSQEYFAGRRVRYVSPVRLFVFLSIVTFFVAQLLWNWGPDAVQFENRDSIDRATTVEEVVAARDQTLAGLATAREKIPDVPGARKGIERGERQVRAKAERRIAQLQAGKPGAAAASEDEEDTPDLEFNGRQWDPATNPVVVRWLPGFANAWINRQIGKGRDNLAELKKDPNRLKNAVLGALPSTLFVLLPIFALMLKLAYFFQRRLYMEHLIVALHSHAFLCLTLLLVFGASALGDAVPALSTATGWLEGLLFLWMPVYLLLMQKRIYGQGWAMTLLKYCVLGFCYFILLTFGVTITFLGSLVWA
ncbi:MAG: DUF3667 domain-containing protein [Luteimonas sp.]